MNKFIIKYSIIFVSFISILFFSLVYFNKYMTEKMAESMMYGAYPPPPPPIIIPLVLIIALSFCFVFIILKYIYKNFIAPLESIEKNVRKIKDNNLDVKFETDSENKTVIDTFGTLNKMTEGLIQKEKLQNDFIRNLVHDLRAPIVAAERAMDILKDEIDDDLFCALKENSDSYLKLVNSIIETITKKEIKMDKITFALLPLVDNVVEALKFLIDEKNIEIKNEIDENFKIWADYISINRIILNLISNAIEHNQDKTITLKAFSKDCSVLIIEDNGSGIKNPNEIFKKHISINNSENKKISGLGLSIVKELVEANEGQIEVETEENKYTRFVIKLPKEGNCKK